MILVNLVPVNRGGGLQNALSFLSCLKSSRISANPYIVVCVRGGPIEQACKTYELMHITVPGGLGGRIWFELWAARKLVLEHQAKVVFTLFGAAPAILPAVGKVSGFAYSNIIQRDIPFWKFLPLHRRLQKTAIDFLRLRLARRSDDVIVETQFLAEHARMGVFHGKRVHVVPMAPSALVLKGIAKARQRTAKDKWDILYLAGPHPNKRIHLLAEIFAAINHKEHRFNLVTTLDERSRYYIEVVEAFRRQGMCHVLCNIGPVAPESVGALLSTVDAVVNIALLESFSNNWVEAWAAGLPLIATDAEWCRHSCADAAIYVNPLRPDEAAARIAEALRSPTKVESLREAGKKRLAMLPTPLQKIAMYADIISRHQD